MNCIFARRGYPEEATGGIAVTISNTGDATNCCVQHGGNTYYTDGDTFSVLPGDTIIFTIYGRSSNNGYVMIDNTTVLSTNSGKETYSWTVPSGIAQASISLFYSGGKAYYSRITVTTS
ncbi:MAG: hypothetical protein IKZ82_06175 [Clostridia bacterium]|nr:hypothetical protein [Clostridia bacterium]